MARAPRRGAVPLVMTLLALVALTVSACTSSTGTMSAGAGSTSAATASTAASPPALSSTSSSPAAAKPVHIKLLNEDGSTYGVGMPVIAYFSARITSATALQSATTVSVDGKAASGAWFFETSDAHPGYPIEGHFRLQNYWPAHAAIHVGIPAQGLSAGRGLTYDDSLTSDFTTGPANISTVDDSTHRMTVTSDGRVWGTFPVSLGEYPATPTARGTKVIMDKGRSICMSGPNYHECGIKYTQRLTYGGEYLHSAPWNCVGSAGCVGPANNIGDGDSSNGCTNLTPGDAARLYDFLRIGDVVTYPNANGPAMTLGAGYGDWNLAWSTWLTGGLVTTA